MTKITLSWLLNSPTLPPDDLLLESFKRKFGETTNVKLMVEWLHRRENERWEAWLLSFDPGLTKAMIKHGANVHANGEEALCKVIYRNHLKVAELLVRHGADIHYDRDKFLRLAAKRGCLEIVKLLIKFGADIHTNKDEALAHAVNYENLRMINLLIRCGATIRQEIIEVAIGSRNRDDINFIKQCEFYGRPLPTTYEHHDALSLLEAAQKKSNKK